jgi:GcrA cell cycle regulator
MLDRPIHRDQSEWTEARTEELTRRWLAGESAAQIAAAMGNGTTRNAVMGNLHRLKLALRFAPGKSRPKAQRTVKAETGTLKAYVAVQHRAESATIKPPMEPVPVDDGVDATHLLGILQLTDKTGKWPQGDPLLPGFGFCGRHSEEGSPYCAAHHARAFTRS